MIAPEFIVFAVMIVGSLIVFSVIAVNLIAYAQKKGWLKPK